MKLDAEGLIYFSDTINGNHLYPTKTALEINSFFKVDLLTELTIRSLPIKHYALYAYVGIIIFLPG